MFSMPQVQVPPNLSVPPPALVLSTSRWSALRYVDKGQAPQVPAQTQTSPNPGCSFCLFLSFLNQKKKINRIVFVERLAVKVVEVKFIEFALTWESNQGLDITSLGICTPRSVKRLWMCRPQSLYLWNSTGTPSFVLCQRIASGPHKNQCQVPHNTPSFFIKSHDTLLEYRTNYLHSTCMYEV